MVNMWTTEIGRYKAASVGLLKTIFEVNLKLFGQEGKKRILFILRDFNEVANTLLILKQQISKTMEEIWDKIKKPAALSLCNVFDCFEFDFHTISAKDFKPEEFKRDINNLRDKFMNAERSDYLFRYKKTDIPIDGIPLYYSEIWNLITSDKDLNIPSQKEMLANLRCNELKFEALKEFQNKVQVINKQIGVSVVPDLGNQFKILYDETLKIYDEDASGYYENTYKTIREELLNLILDQSKDLFNIQMKFIVNLSIKKAKDLIAKKIPKNQAIEEFSNIVEEIISSIKEDFNTQASSSIAENSGWESSQYEEELTNSLNEKISEEKDKQIVLLDNEIKSAFTGKFNTEIGKIFDLAVDLNVWDKLKRLQQNTMAPLEARIKRILYNLEKSEDEVKAYINLVKIKCVEAVRLKLDKFIKTLEEFMTKKFTIFFNKDENGIPRDPKNTNYEQVFSASKDRVIPILEQFRYFKISPEWEDTQTEESSEELLDQDSYERILEGFLKDAERSYKDALHIKEFGYNRGGMPKWLILLLVLLGWNELLWVLQSPIILYPSIFLGSIIGLLFSMGLGSIPKFIFGQIIRKVPFLV